MLTGITVAAKELLSTFIDLGALLPKGTQVIPIAFVVDKGAQTVKIICNTGCYYYKVITYTGEAPVVDNITVVYRNVIDFVPKDGSIDLLIEGHGVTIRTEQSSILLPVGYSVVEEQNVVNIEGDAIISDMYRPALKAMLDLGLGDLYSRDRSVTVYGDTAVQLYPNVVVQVRTTGLPFPFVLSTNMVKLLLSFNPTSINYTEAALQLCKRNATLILPYEAVDDVNHFTDYMKDMNVVLSVCSDTYFERLKAMQKLTPKGKCFISIHKEGIATSINEENVNIQTSAGNIDSELVTAFSLPLNLWVRLTKTFSKGTFEILYGGGKVCLRNSMMIIITRVLN